MKRKVFLNVLCAVMMTSLAGCSTRSDVSDVMSTSVIQTVAADELPANDSGNNLTKLLEKAKKTISDAMKDAEAKAAQSAENAESSATNETETTDEISEVNGSQTEVSKETTENTTVEVAKDTVDAPNSSETTSIPKATYTYTDVSATMYATGTVNVRNLPDTTGEKVGSLSMSQEVIVTGQCNETGWYRFDYNGSTAYVSNDYLSDTKIEVPDPVPAPVPDTATVPSDNGGSSTDNSEKAACPYPLDKALTETSEYGLDYEVIYSTIYVKTLPELLDYYYNAGMSIEGTTVYDVYGGSSTSNLIGQTLGYDVSISPYPQNIMQIRNMFGIDYGWVEHTTYPAPRKVGTYAEGTVYKYIAGKHYVINGICNEKNRSNCQPGSITVY